jgi:polyphenol oxidase
MSDCVFYPDWPDLPAHIVALTTIRSGGVSGVPYHDGKGGGGFNLATHVGDQAEHVLQNRRLLASYLPNDPEWLTQVHGTRVLDLDMEHGDLIADACVTSRPGVVCAVQTADCLPVLFCDAKTNVVAAAHAGWRGLAHGVLENTLDTMLAAGADIGNVMVWLGPAIGPDQFEVGAEVRQQFVDVNPCAIAAFKSSPNNPDKFYADIYLLARLGLQRAGVVNIAGGGFCTVSETDKFYSYRRDGVTGRMASLIWVKATV